MSAIRVEQVKLQLVAAEPMRQQIPTLQSNVIDEFLPAVIRAIQQRLRRRYGEHAIFRIPRIKFQCTLPVHDLTTNVYLDQLAQDLADYVEAQIEQQRKEKISFSSDTTAQVFKDRHQYEAVKLIHLLNKTNQANASAHPTSALWQAITKQGSAYFAQILEHCFALGQLELVLEALPTNFISLVESALSHVTHDNTRVAVRRWAKTQRPAEPFKSEHSERAQPDHKQPKKANDDPHSDADKTLAEIRAEASKTNDTKTISKPEHLAAQQTLKHTDNLPASSKAQSASDQSNEPHRSAEISVPGQSARINAHNLLEPDKDYPLEPTEKSSSASQYPFWVQTDCSGLLYLLTLIEQLELPERLWQIGLQEATALTYMLECIAPIKHDNLPRTLIQDVPANLPELAKTPRWAYEEIAQALTTKLYKMSGASDAHVTENQIERIRNWFVRDDETLEYELVTWCAACLLVALEIKLNRSVDAGEIDTLFGGRGTIELNEDSLILLQPMASINMDIRRAGLDRNPGHIAWLKRSVSFEFGDESLVS